MFDYEIPSAYPAAKDRTVKIEGNVITFPVFSKPAGNVHFESYRYVFFPRERLMHRFKDQFNADTHMNILRFNRNGLDSATVSFLSGADGITLRRFKENRGDDQFATAKKEVPGNR
ncbi:MAG: hypothetical protein AAF802_01340 [Planctomycetota bacterium]